MCDNVVKTINNVKSYPQIVKKLDNIRLRCLCNLIIKFRLRNQRSTSQGPITRIISNVALKVECRRNCQIIFKNFGKHGLKFDSI